MAASSPKDRLRVRPLKEHPLAGRRVVRNSDLSNGAPVYVVDWTERLKGPWARHPSQVLVREGDGRLCLVSPDDLPSYDPVPLGTIS